MTASLIETCKLNCVDPLAWMTDVLTKLVNLWPASRISELMRGDAAGLGEEAVPGLAYGVGDGVVVVE